MTLPTITSSQRNVLYREVMTDLSGISQLWPVIERHDFESAYSLARIYSDDLLLILNDLGFGDLSFESKKLRSPRDVLMRVLTRLHQRAAEDRRTDEGEWAESRCRQEKNRKLTETCYGLLGAAAFDAPHLPTGTGTTGADDGD